MELGDRAGLSALGVLEVEGADQVVLAPHVLRHEVHLGTEIHIHSNVTSSELRCTYKTDLSLFSQSPCAPSHMKYAPHL